VREGSSNVAPERQGAITFVFAPDRDPGEKTLDRTENQLQNYGAIDMVHNCHVFSLFAP
jgi:hypothetical protein